MDLKFLTRVCPSSTNKMHVTEIEIMKLLPDQLQRVEACLGHTQFSFPELFLLTKYYLKSAPPSVVSVSVNGITTHPVT